MSSVNSERVLNYMKENYGKEMTKQDIAAALGISIYSVIGSMNFLVKNNYATKREETFVEQEATETRKAKMGKHVYHMLTETGLAYDPVAVEAERLAEKERIKAEKAAAKAAQNA